MCYIGTLVQLWLLRDCLMNLCIHICRGLSTKSSTHWYCINTHVLHISTKNTIKIYFWQSSKHHIWLCQCGTLQLERSISDQFSQSIYFYCKTTRMLPYLILMSNFLYPHVYLCLTIPNDTLNHETKQNETKLGIIQNHKAEKSHEKQKQNMSFIST